MKSVEIKEEWGQELETTWSQSTTTSVGIEAQGVETGAETTMTIGGATRTSYMQSLARAIGKTWSQESTVEMSDEGRKQGDHVWEWKLSSYNGCNELASVTVTNKRVITSQRQSPCCLPGYKIEKDESKCQRGGSLFNSDNLHARPAHCCRGRDRDRYKRSCPGWTWACKSKKWRAWMKWYCFKTCGYCE